MSPQNVDSVRRMVQALNNSDVEALVAECDPIVEWEEQSIPGLEPVYRGHEGVRRWAAILFEDEDLGSLEGRLEGLEEADDAVIASVRIEGEGTRSGLRVQMHPHLVFTFRDGKVVRRQVFLTLAEALRAAGLRE